MTDIGLPSLHSMADRAGMREDREEDNTGEKVCQPELANKKRIQSQNLRKDCAFSQVSPRFFRVRLRQQKPNHIPHHDQSQEASDGK